MRPESVTKLQEDYTRYLAHEKPEKRVAFLKDSNPRGLCKCISNWLYMNKFYSTKQEYWISFVHSKDGGKRIADRTKFHDCDLIAIVNGHTVCIDCFFPDDLEDIKADTEDYGGVYIYCTSFDEFLSKINKYL